MQTLEKKNEPSIPPFLIGNELSFRKDLLEAVKDPWPSAWEKQGKAQWCTSKPQTQTPKLKYQASSQGRVTTGQLPLGKPLLHTPSASL